MPEAISQKQNTHKALMHSCSVDWSKDENGNRWSKVCSKIIDSFQLLKQTLKERAECREDVITIFDPPYTIEILRNKEQIVLRAGDELAILSKNGLHAISASDDDIEVLRDWCIALTALTFRRYIAKKG